MNDKLAISFVGDIMLGELLENLKRGVKSKIEGGIDPFEYVKPIFKKSDIVVGNLECVLSDVSPIEYPFSETLRAPEKYATILKNAGITIVNLANNHTLDHGEEGLKRTISSLEKAGILYFGRTLEEDFQKYPVIVKSKGYKIGFLGYNLANKSMKELVNRKEEILKVIKNVRNDVDFLVLSLHWGMEYVNFPSWPYTEMAREFANAGVDIIHGHHSHQAQGVVMDKGKIIAFSLGNFIFDDLRKENRITLILTTYLGSGVEYRLTPLFINRDFQPKPEFNNLKLNKYIKKLNDIAEKVYFDDDNKYCWYEKAKKVSRRGHMKNRIRIRMRILIRPDIYYNTILALLKRKITQ